MQNSFQVSSLHEAKHILTQELQMAEHKHRMQKERQKELRKKRSLAEKVKSFFGKIF